MRTRRKGTGRWKSLPITPMWLGTNVEDLAHAMTVQLLYEFFIPFGRADLGIQGVVVDDVVTMHASRPGSQVRRDVNVADSKLAEVGNSAAALRKVKSRFNCRR